MTSCSKGSLVGWDRGDRGSKGGGRVPLGKRVPLSGKVLLGGRVVFWGFYSELKLLFKEYRLVLGFHS